MQFGEQNSAVQWKEKCEWERFWDVDKEEGEGEFLILQSANPPL